MKVKLLFMALIMSILVTGCGKKDEVAPTTPDTSVVAENNENTTTDVPAETDPTTENTPETTEPVEPEKEPEVTPKSFTEEITALTKSSDYISLIKMTQTGASGIEVHVMEDLKGSLKNIVLPDLVGIEPNKDYLVFLMDSENGDITLTDIDKAVIYIADENNEALKITRELMAPKE